MPRISFPPEVSEIARPNGDGRRSRDFVIPLMVFQCPELHRLLAGPKRHSCAVPAWFGVPVPSDAASVQL